MKATIKLLGGNVDKNLIWIYEDGCIRGFGPAASGWGSEAKFRYEVRRAKELAVADQSVGVKVLGAAGWGAAGALVAGPVGAIVGGLLGGRGESVTFVTKFNDDKTMMGQVPKKIWIQMLSHQM